MATLKLTNVKKVYANNTVAVRDFSLEVGDKEFIVFVGPSGCGKSTTLRMIAGLEDISAGTIEIDGKIVNDLEPRDRDIAMVFQNYALYPHLTVYENMAFALRLRRVPNDVIYEKVMSVAQSLGIVEYLTRKPKALSGGQRQRVAIGRAMVRDSKVFLMDEPLSNLDAKLRNQMRAEIILLRQKIDSTFIYVTHDQTEAMTLGDRIVIMKDGFIQQVGTPSEVFFSPVNLFVAGFIGAPQMNFFKTLIKEDNGEYAVTLYGVDIRLDKQRNELLKANGVEAGEVILGVRPEHVTLANESDKNAFCAVIEVSEMMGSEYYLHVVCPDGTKIIVRVPTLNLSNEQRESLNLNAQIYLTFTQQSIHLFDSISSRNLCIDPDIYVPQSTSIEVENAMSEEKKEQSFFKRFFKGVKGGK